MTRLLYRLVPHNRGAVFATEDRARLIAQIHEALSSARTWGEFRRLMPNQEYRNIRREFDEQGEPRPRLDEAFSAEQVGGFSDGDYPPWLQTEMGGTIPRDILERFGTRQSAFLNGDYWHIPQGQMEPMADALRQRGFEVVQAQELHFH
jgi:hypothetical protein